MRVGEAHTCFPLAIGPGPGQAPAAGEAEGDDAHEASERRGRGVEHGRVSLKLWYAAMYAPRVFCKTTYGHSLCPRALTPTRLTMPGQVARDHLRTTPTAHTCLPMDVFDVLPELDAAGKGPPALVALVQLPAATRQSLVALRDEYRPWRKLYRFRHEAEQVDDGSGAVGGPELCHVIWEEFLHHALELHVSFPHIEQGELLRTQSATEVARVGVGPEAFTDALPGAARVCEAELHPWRR